MRKLILSCLLALSFLSTYGQGKWQPGDPGGLIYSDREMTVILSRKSLTIQGVYPLKVDIVLYDSIGHPVREWKNIYLNDTEEESRYQIIYDFVTRENGWIRINKKDIPTKRREEEEYF